MMSKEGICKSEGRPLNPFGWIKRIFHKVKNSHKAESLTHKSALSDIERHGNNMSENIINSSRQLNELIRESEEYQKFCLYKKELSQIPELFERVQEFRKRNFVLQIEADTYDKEAASRLSDEFRGVLENPLVASYLNAELAFCKMSQNIFKEVCDGIELELDFL